MEHADSSPSAVTELGATPHRNGTSAHIEAATNLWVDGPRVRVRIGAHPREVAQLARSGRVAPAPIDGWALIDTSTLFTVIDARIARALGLEAIARLPTKRDGDAGWTEQAVYRLALECEPDDGHRRFLLDEVVEYELDVQGVIALIGRDVLRRCAFIYDGLRGVFRMVAPPMRVRRRAAVAARTEGT